MCSADFEAFLLQVFLEHANQLDVIVNQQDLVHGAHDNKSALPASSIFTRFYLLLTALYRR
ncbi:hypothetical protein D3C85_1764350 [compost metagenome]